MKPGRLRAPTTHGALLAAPSLDEAGGLLRKNLAERSKWDHDFQGRSFAVLREMARRDLLVVSRAWHEEIGIAAGPDPGEAKSEPWIVTGHQPELFHPGVWVKNFVAGELAREHGGLGIHLVVDNDIPKSAGVRVPAQRQGLLGAATVEFDSVAPEVPFEAWHPADRALFDSFPDRVGADLKQFVERPILDDYWREVRAFMGRGFSIGGAFAATRRRVEGAWGLANLEAPLGRLEETESFGWFFCHLVAQLPRFQTIHNAALDAYRRYHRIRSKNHPVPELRTDGDWRETPFWVWRAGDVRRRPLMARCRGRGLALRIAGEGTDLLELALGASRDACCAVEQFRSLPERGVSVRTRALTTTMFARLLLGDLFIHGIGGAKYDELGDTIIHHFFNLNPPAFLTASLTLWLGLPEPGADLERSRGLEREARELIHQPERHIERPDATQLALIERKRAAIAGPTATHRERKQRCLAIRAANSELAASLGPRRQVTLESLAEVRRQLRARRWARFREYPAVLYPADRLRDSFAAATGWRPAPAASSFDDTTIYSPEPGPLQ